MDGEGGIWDLARLCVYLGMKRLLIILLMLAGPAAISQELTVKQFLKLSEKDTTSYAVKGVVSSIRSSVRGSFYLKDNTGTLLVYGIQDREGHSFKEMDIVQGDTLTVLGRFTVYGGATKEMKDGRLLAKADGPDHNLSFYDRLDRKPSFKGKEGQEGLMVFRSWVQSHLKWQEGEGSGTVRVSFVVGRKGGVQEVQVVSGATPAMNAEAVRVVSSAPKWKPAVSNGSPVRCVFTIPIIFDSVAIQ